MERTRLIRKKKRIIFLSPEVVYFHLRKNILAEKRIGPPLSVERKKKRGFSRVITCVYHRTGKAKNTFYRGGE